MVLLTLEEAQTLMDARNILKAVASRAQDEGIKHLVEHKSEDYPDADAYDFGMVTQAARTAEWDVFNVLNVMQNHIHDGVAEVILA